MEPVIHDEKPRTFKHELKPIPPYSLHSSQIKADERNFMLGVESVIVDGRGVKWKSTHISFVSDMTQWLELPDVLHALYVFKSNFYQPIFVEAENADEALVAIRAAKPWGNPQYTLEAVFVP